VSPTVDNANNKRRAHQRFGAVVIGVGNAEFLGPRGAVDTGTVGRNGSEEERISTL
jgi:hypothetical protein